MLRYWTDRDKIQVTQWTCIESLSLLETKSTTTNFSCLYDGYRRHVLLIFVLFLLGWVNLQS